MQVSKIVKLLSTCATTVLLAACGGGGGGSGDNTGYVNNDKLTVTVKATPSVISPTPYDMNMWPWMTPNLSQIYVQAKDSDGRAWTGGTIACSITGGLESGWIYSFDNEHAQIKNDVVVAYYRYRNMALTANAGTISFWIAATDITGTVTIECSAADSSNSNKLATGSTQVRVGGVAASGLPSQITVTSVATDSQSSPSSYAAYYYHNYIFAQGQGGATQAKVETTLVDVNNQLVSAPAGVNNVTARIASTSTSVGALLRGVNAQGQTVSGNVVSVPSINGLANFSVSSGTFGYVAVEIYTDYSDNNVDNGIATRIYNTYSIPVYKETPSDVALEILTISNDQGGTVQSTTDADDGDLHNPLPNGQLGVDYFGVLEAKGGAYGYKWALVSGPSWLKLSPTGELSGKPTSAGGVYIKVSATDINGVSVTKDLVFYIADSSPVAINSTEVTAVTGVPLTIALEATGGVEPYTWSASGLSCGLTLDTQSGVISGTPTCAAGQYSFIVTVKDSLGKTVSKNVSLKITAPSGLAVTPAQGALTDAKVGTAYTQVFAASGGTSPYTCTISFTPALPSPSGLTISGCAFTGTPASTAVGSYLVTVIVTDGASPAKTVTQLYSLKIAP